MTGAPRILPVVIVALAALGGLKLADAVFGLSSADAAEATPGALSPPPDAPKSEVEKRLLDQLAARRAALDAREAELDTRAQLLEGAERRLEDKIAAFQNERAALAAVSAESDRRKTEEFDALSSAYEKMKPRDAARIFDILEDDILVPVAAGMRTQSLSGVLAEMNPDRARQLTRLLAAHRASAPAPERAP